MCSLATKTPTELNAMTKAQLIAAALEGVTQCSAVLAHDAKGNAVRIDEITTDAYGTLMGTREILWTYYDTGEVDEITVTDKDAKGKMISGYTVKHYRGEKQPTLTMTRGLKG